MSIPEGEQRILTPHREIPRHRDNRSNPECGVEAAHLIPGGRITLWDMGATCFPPEVQPRILDTILSETEEFGIGIFSPSTPVIYRGNRLRISASFLLQQGDLRCVTVYEVGALPESTDIRLVGQLDNMGPALTWLFGDRVLVELCPRDHQKHGYQVWDPTRKLVTDQFALSGRGFLPRWQPDGKGYPQEQGQDEGNTFRVEDPWPF
ncbi:hypothetical protein DFP72DRAFT_847897 [Ephemerocybe angulata]|uniref:Uncharacterized protein n=1 Tax=Ephemerocybe angulata TaxID=980116 RepID=A0A8H6HZ21_9AGAR|nr:hypothetical protein DFP72DRAFT_847897 [Tulosesus angulatus]